MPNAFRYLAWTITAASAALYLVMVAVTLPHLGALVAGAPVFDLRLLGYGFADAQDLVARLGVDGAAYYENVQHRLDSIFPVLLALSLVYWLIAAARRWQGHGLPLSGAVLAAMLAVVAIANAADLGENAAVSVMLAAGPKALTPGMVHIASSFTLAKSFFSSVAYVSLLILALGPSVAALFRRKKL
jgi:hypothetical protein